MKFGASDVAAMKLGAADVSRVYLGASLVWEAGGAVFSPADLFASGEAGFWGQVQTSDLWQDVARTTPVTATGQEVLSWRQRTSGADIYLTQATAGSGPVYRVDGDGLPYLDFAGGKWMVSPTITPGADKVQLFAGIMLGDGATRIILESSPITDSNNGSIMLFYTTSGVPTLRFRSKGTVISDAVSAVTQAFSTKYRVTGLGDISGDTATLRVDEVQVGNTTTDQGSGNYLAYQVYLGKRGSAAFQFSGRVYSLILRYGANLSSGQIADAEAWVDALLNP